jgi:hypothetical protein
MAVAEEVLNQKEEGRREAADPAQVPEALSKVKVIAVDMGYGHNRAAQAFATVLNTPVWQVDVAPIAGAEERRSWSRTRAFYEGMSRASQLGALARPFRSLLENVTSIPHLHPYRDLSGPTIGSRGLKWLIERGLGRGMLEALSRDPGPVLTTFYAPALIADHAGLRPSYCVVTDADINRVWAPADPATSEVIYFAPSQRALLRLRAYGVRPDHIHMTGFPLPPELLGGPDLQVLRANLAARLVRLDPSGVFRDSYRDDLDHFLGPLPTPARKAPLVTFVVGGAGSQEQVAKMLLTSFKKSIEAGKIQLALAAGTHAHLGDQFREWTKELGLESRLGDGLEILYTPDLWEYFRLFNKLLAETDILFTKPSEMTFFAALGLPLVFSWPVGVHERYNRRWAIEGGAGLKQRDLRFTADWIDEWLQDGTLAGAAWSGFMRLPKFGLYRILEFVAKGEGAGAQVSSSC